MPILTVDKLSIKENSKLNRVVVQEITFTLEKGEILGIVGESGSGKTVTALSILNLLPKDLEILTGKICFLKRNLKDFSEKEWEKIRGKEISMIFQNPISSLNPLIKAGNQIVEIIKNHSELSKSQCIERAFQVLKDVGFENPEDIFYKYPHQLSGGQGQRVGIAMAIANNPKILIADEPTTALDTESQNQVLNILKEIQKKYNTSIIIISHDLGIIKKFTDKAIVMYYGEIVEIQKTESLFALPKHPYTKGLLDSLPENFKKGEPIKAMIGAIPSIDDKIEGCFFSPRCPKVLEKCKKNKISLEKNINGAIRCINQY